MYVWMDGFPGALHDDSAPIVNQQSPFYHEPYYARWYHVLFRVYNATVELRFQGPILWGNLFCLSPIPVAATMLRLCYQDALQTRVQMRSMAYIST